RSSDLEDIGHLGVEDLVDQGRLARTGDSGDGGGDSERDGDGDIAQIVLHSLLDGDHPVLVDGAAARQYLDLAATGQLVAGDGARGGRATEYGAGIAALTAVFTAA